MLYSDIIIINITIIKNVMILVTDPYSWNPAKTGYKLYLLQNKFKDITNLKQGTDRH